MSRKLAAVLGNGQMAAQCTSLIAEHEAFARPMIIHSETGGQLSSPISKVSNKFGIKQLIVGNVNDTDAVEMLKDFKPDIVFSVNNWDVIRAGLLAIPVDGIINFHNGPLPDYRGVNAPSWAIINGEERHGVAWHLVSARIDEGDIVASQSFALSPQETAISLTLRCIKTGLELFSPLLDHYASGTLKSWPQKAGGSYYSARDLPPNEGYLAFNWSFDRLSALVRGLSFRPFDNLFTYPKIRAGDATLLLSEITFCEGRSEQDGWNTGEIRAIDERGIVVCAGDGLVRLSGLMEEDLNEPGVPEIVSRYDLAPGRVLS